MEIYIALSADNSGPNVPNCDFLQSLFRIFNICLNPLSRTSHQYSLSDGVSMLSHLRLQFSVTRSDILRVQPQENTKRQERILMKGTIFILLLAALS